MANSPIWLQAGIVILVGLSALFIPFGPDRSEIRWKIYLGILVSISLFGANQLSMSRTGEGLDRHLNCWLWPMGVSCGKLKEELNIRSAGSSNNSGLLPINKTLLVESLRESGLTAVRSEYFVKARRFFEQACISGDALSCLYLGDLWKLGRGGPTNEVKARKLYMLSCERAEARGCHSLGIMAEHGQGGIVDYALARELYKQGCDGGVAGSCSNFALIIKQGLGGDPDEFRARMFYEQGCNMGDMRGCEALGLMWERGEGGRVDVEIAQKFLQKACDNVFLGNPLSCHHLNRVSSR